MGAIALLIDLVGRSPSWVEMDGLGHYFREFESELGPDFSAVFASGDGPVYIEERAIGGKMLGCDHVACAENLVV
ncbi:MAG: hypothetical protein HC860_24115 [Alkalinema sp. RU_4_3]|nr:hypothetical protein [Alkalinema sp. RU_4_3]